MRVFGNLNMSVHMFFQSLISRSKNGGKVYKKIKIKRADNLRDVDAINADRAFKLPR